jgi:hypothetical protein
MSTTSRNAGAQFAEAADIPLYIQILLAVDMGEFLVKFQTSMQSSNHSQVCSLVLWKLKHDNDRAGRQEIGIPTPPTLQAAVRDISYTPVRANEKDQISVEVKNNSLEGIKRYTKHLRNEYGKGVRRVCDRAYKRSDKMHDHMLAMGKHDDGARICHRVL